MLISNYRLKNGGIEQVQITVSIIDDVFNRDVKIIDMNTVKNRA